MSYIVSISKKNGQVCLRNNNLPTGKDTWYFCPNQIPSLQLALSKAMNELVGMCKAPEWLVDEANPYVKEQEAAR